MHAPALPIFPPLWRQLQPHEEVRIRQQDTTIQLISQQVLHQNRDTFHTHIETLYILRQLAARLFSQPIRPPSDALLDNRVDTIHRRIFENLNLNLQTTPNRAILEPIHTELQEMIAFILKRREDKKALRTTSLPKKEISPERKGDEILKPAAVILTPKMAPIPPSIEEQQKHFQKVVKSLEQLTEEEKRLKLHREQQAQTLAQAHQGYNPLDPKSTVPGNYFQFIHGLQLRIGNQEPALLSCRHRVEECLKALLICSLVNIPRPEECREVLERWTQWVDANEVDRIHFGRLVGLCLSEEHTYLLLGQALHDDLTSTTQLNEVFRSTHLLRGTIIGGFFTRLAQQTIHHPIRQFLVNLEKTPLAADEASILPYVQSLLDLIRIQFLKCSFTPVATELLNQAQLKIYEKWHVSGLKHLLGTLFLRGATYIITDYSHNSPNKMALRQLGKLLQREINLFSNWTFKEMENHLLGLLQQHSRKYPQGFNPFHSRS